MRTLGASLLTELGLTVTRPGYLVEIAFSTPLRLSTMGDVTFNSQAWSAADVQVRGLSADGQGGQGGSLLFGNTWDDYGALVLNEGIADRAIQVWACYAGAPGDSVQIFDGVGDDADWDDAGRLTIRLAQSAVRSAFWPRTRINAAAGFNHLIPAGSKITVAGQTYILERR